jgi:hypothetical protein
LCRNFLTNRPNETQLFIIPVGGSRHSDWLRAGRQRGWSSSPGRVKNFLFYMSSKPALGFTQPPIQWLPRALSLGIKTDGE